MINSIIDPRVPFGTAINQMLVWNPTTELYEVSVSLSGLTLVSPIISGDFSWQSGDSTWNLGAGDKTILMSHFSTFKIEDSVSLSWIEINANPGTRKIDFGNGAALAYNFLGTGLTTFGANIDVTGKILANGGFIGDDADNDLIEIDGFNGKVTVDGDFIADTGRFDDGIGIGQDALATRGVVVTKTFTDTAFAFAGSPTLDTSTALNKTLCGASFSSIFGAGSNAQAKLCGVLSVLNTAAYTGALIDAVGYEVTPQLGTSGTTATNFFGFKVSNFPAGPPARLTNSYGLWLPDYTTNYVTNKWSIYSLGGNMAHVGNVRIGDTTAPTEALEVVGSVVEDTATGSRYLLRYSLMGA